MCALSSYISKVTSASVGIVMVMPYVDGAATRAKAMHETRLGTNVQLTFVIHQQLTYQNMLNSVHNCESHTCNAFINSHINWLIAIFLMALTIVVSCCSVPSCTSINRRKRGG